MTATSAWFQPGGIDDFAIAAPAAHPDQGPAPLSRVYVVAERENWASHLDLAN